MNDPEVFKLGTGYTQSGMLLGLKVKGQGHGANKSILHTRTVIHRHSLGGVKSSAASRMLSACFINIHYVE